MEVDTLLSLLPDDLLMDLAIETGVDHYAKKLQGEVLFKLLLHCLLTHKENSLRGLQSAFESLAFQLLNQRYGSAHISYSSISERLCSIEVSYFEKLYQACVRAYRHLLGDDALCTSFDSTIVSLSTALLCIGYHLPGDAHGVRQLKFTLGYSEIPCSVQLYLEPGYNSENKALKEAMLTYEGSSTAPGRIYVFDRGITSRATYEELSNRHMWFVSRLSEHALYLPCSSNALEKPLQTPTLEIRADQWVYLYASHGGATHHAFRLITAQSKDTHQTLQFITNLEEQIDATQITELYKKRWDIEVFFKFLKQHLNAAHLISRSVNGIQVILYVTLIASILVAAYKKMKGLCGFKIPKQQLAQQLEFALVKDLILLCGGNPDLIYQFVSPNSS